jgi:hypothetical protein
VGAGHAVPEEPTALRRYRVASGSPADGTAISDLATGENLWISMVNRDGRLLPGNETVVRTGDEILTLVHHEVGDSDAGVLSPPLRTPATAEEEKGRRPAFESALPGGPQPRAAAAPNSCNQRPAASGTGRGRHLVG